MIITEDYLKDCLKQEVTGERLEMLLNADELPVYLTKLYFEVLLYFDLTISHIGFSANNVGDNVAPYNLRYSSGQYTAQNKKKGRAELISGIDEFFFQEIEEVSNKLRKKLDIACGDGERTKRYDTFLSKKSKIESYGCDLSVIGVEAARTLGINATVQNMTSLEYNNSYFDLVTLLFNSLGHLDTSSIDIAFGEAVRVLKKGGLLFFDVNVFEESKTFFNSKLYLSLETPIRLQLARRRLDLALKYNQKYMVYTTKSSDILQSAYLFEQPELQHLAYEYGLTIHSMRVFDMKETYLSSIALVCTKN